ncbi:terminase [Cupriavidus metallidurans]
MAAVATTPEYNSLPTDEAELKACLRDPNWRIRNLYKVKNKQKRIVPFRPNEAQERFLRTFWYRNVIPKARQRGFSTLIQLLALDMALFLPGSDAGVIAQDLDTAMEIFSSKIKLAYDHLPNIIKEMVPVTSSTLTSITFGNGSKVRIGTSMRGGTPNFVHVSEFGKISAKYPDKAREVLTGTIPAVPDDGLVFIESTAEGRDGAFYNLASEAKADADSGRKLTPLDFRLHFASWWDAKEYELDPEGVVITEKDHKYFDGIEAKIKRKISLRKRAWYVTVRRKTFGGDQQMMFQEYPSTFDEAFSVSMEGTYYAEQIAQARKDGRFKEHIPVMPGVACFTFWDIGNSDGTAIWVIQKIGMEWRCIRFKEGWGEPYSHFARWLQGLGLTFDTHFLPHDADHERQGETTNKSPREMLEGLLPGHRFEVVPRIEEINWGIQHTRDVFSMLWFDETECKDGIIHIENYRRKWNERQACWSAVPDKTGGHSEAADGLRQFAQAHQAGLININRGSTKRKRTGSWRTN